MPDKNTEKLENELSKAADVKNFIKDNEKNFRSFTLDAYLCLLLKEKNLSKAQVVKASQLGDYAYNFFAGRKNTSRENILSIALAMKLSPKETDYLLYYSGHEKLYLRSK